jgi:hypothetical protein
MSVMPSIRRLLLAGAAVAVVVVSCAVVCAEASVHEYAGERFAGVGNGFVLHGGSEGVYASATAESFVRYGGRSWLWVSSVIASLFELVLGM